MASDPDIAFLPDPHQLPTPQDTQSPFFSNTHIETTDSPTAFANHSTSYTPVDAMTPISTNPSRKRSRDFDAECSDYFPTQQVNTPAPIPEEEPIYGEGMVLLNPRTGMSVSAESQTGTWYEEKAEAVKSGRDPADEGFRPKIPTRKSMRMDSTTSLPRLDDIAQAVAPESPPKSAPAEPEVDEYTIALGIGWTGMASEDLDMQAAVRGWARYLENHYSRHIHNAQMLSKSKSLNAYLVQAQEGFYLFQEDLLQGQMVGSDWQSCLRNLLSRPIAFEGEVLSAERTPGPEEKTLSSGFASAMQPTDESWVSDDMQRQEVVNVDQGMELD